MHLLKISKADFKATYRVYAVARALTCLVVTEDETLTMTKVPHFRQALFPSDTFIKAKKLTFITFIPLKVH